MKIHLKNIDLTDTTFMSRIDFDEEHIRQLARDIEKFGQRNPIGVREIDERYQVIYGWSRIKAIQLLGWELIDATYYGEISDLDAQLHNLSDNVTHQDLTVLETANIIKKLRTDHKLTVDEIAKFFEDKTQKIYDMLMLTEMKEEIQIAVHEGQIGLTHAIEINKFPDSSQLEILRETINRGLTVNQIKEKRYPKVKIKKSVKEKITELLVEAMKEGEDVPELDYNSLQSIAIESELERARRFFTTQVVPQSYLNNKSAPPEYGGEKGWTRESVVQRRIDYYRYLVEEKGYTLPNLVERINTHIYNMIHNRFKYQCLCLHPVQSKYWDDAHRHIQGGWRVDDLPISVLGWSILESDKIAAERCKHDFDYEEEYGEEICIHCFLTKK